jgi:hypothetical protein
VLTLCCDVTSELPGGELTFEGSVLCSVDWGDVTRKLWTSGVWVDSLFVSEVDMT